MGHTALANCATPIENLALFLNRLASGCALPWCHEVVGGPQFARLGAVDPLLRRYMPDFEYLLVDTSTVNDDTLRQVKSGTLQASLFLLRPLQKNNYSRREGATPEAAYGHLRIYFFGMA